MEAGAGRPGDGDGGKGSKPLDWRVLLEIVGASAGIAAFVTFTGGALLWLRFAQRGLPADRAVSLLPRTMLLTVGAHALLVPALLGVVAVVLIFAVQPGTEWIAGCLMALLAAVVAGAVVWEVAGHKLWLAI